MLDTTFKSYATRQLAAASAALALAAVVALVAPSVARTRTTALPGQEASVQGPATVVDGDTLNIDGVRVRLEGIDAPESAQTCRTAAGKDWSCGTAATRVLERLTAGRDVRCDKTGIDRYGRMLGICYAGGLDLNAEMVRRGFAWAFVRYSAAYVTQEAEAQLARAGVWAGTAVPAWDFRAGKWQQSEGEAPGGCAIKGNVARGERIYHMPWSLWYSRIHMDADKGKRWFCSEAEAIAAGWRPAQQR